MMSKEFGSIWDWLQEDGKPKRLPAPPQPPAQEDEPSHRIDDLTMLALEREAEAAAKLRSRS
jgi:hypothetical protein